MAGKVAGPAPDMMTFLFWNLNQRPLQDRVASLAHRHQADVIMLAECTVEPAALLRALNKDRTLYHYSPSFCRKIHIFSTFPRDFINPIHEFDSLTVRRLRLPGATEILLSVAHLPSKLHWDEQSQSSGAVELANEIKRAEDLAGHSRTVLVGDLNMNPFEAGIVTANGLHGVMSRSIAEKGSRTIQAKSYPFFYNPMWGHFGDRTPGPSGTYYRADAQYRTYFWHMFDQVLIRPDLLPSFKGEELSILESDGEAPLLSTSGIPDQKNASDHLPLLFKLDL